MNILAMPRKSCSEIIPLALITALIILHRSVDWKSIWRQNPRLYKQW